MQFLDKNSIILEPFDATIKHNPSTVWSKARTSDPLHGEFHDYLDEFSMTNKDFDYGKGLVFTWGKDELDIPFEIKTDGSYELYIRYMQNPEGGILKIYLIIMRIKQISTTDQLTKFVWQNIGTFNLTSGRHTLTLENSYGFNAVNIFALIPTTAAADLGRELDSFVDKKRIIYSFEGNSSFYNINREKGEDPTFPTTNGTFEKLFTRQLRVPDNATQISLEFRAKQNPDLASYYQIKEFEINPIHDTNVFASDFEVAADLKKWNNSFPNSQYLSRETINPISGFNSLRVDIAKAPFKSNWNVVNSKDLIAVDENVNLKYQFRLSAVDVNLLHGKVFYYDEKKNLIKGDYIFTEDLRNTFNEKYTNSFVTPEGTKYINLQFWFQTNPERASDFLLDDVKIEQTTNLPSFRNFYDIFRNANSSDQKLTFNGNTLKVDIKEGRASHWNVIQTKPIPIKQNETYNYSIKVKGQNLDSFEGKVVYSTSDI